MFQKLKYILLAIGLFGLWYGCVKKKKYSTAPHIEFKSFDLIPDDTAAANISFTFTDGDGDIGKEPEVQDYNLYINYYYFNTDSARFMGVWDPTHSDSLRNPSVIRKPKDFQTGSPVSGEVTQRLSAYRHSNIKAKRVKYVIYMFDNANNKSNVITTPEFAVP